jgi:hypothetical protein
MKYILKQIDDISGHNTVTTVEFNTDTLDGVIEHVDLFIRGCGFFPPQGATLDYIEDDFPDWVGQDDDHAWHNEEFITPHATGSSEPLFGGAGHSPYFFDTERNK